MRAPLARWALTLGLAATGCDVGHQPAAPIPPAEAYDSPSDFSGIWVGEADGTVGTLEISPLGGSNRYRGYFEGDDVKLEYVLLLEQTEVGDAGHVMAGNRTTFTWQDGRGGRGDGWMLINREDSALTGSFGAQGMMDRELTFIRVE
ncbi:MAG: hypothetical protein AB1Z98_10110 [Nannocystaceae bacterium]